MTGACCGVVPGSAANPSAPAAAAASAVEELTAALEGCRFDPTMADCCKRDLADMARAEQLRGVLLAHDPSLVALKARAQVWGQHAPALQQRAPTAEATEESSDTDLSWDDADLQALRDERLQQLQRQAREQQQQQRQAGYGQLNDVPEARVMALVEQVHGRLVCHLALEGFEPCSHLDEHLASLAHAYQRTYFARAVVGRRSRLVAQLGLERVPGLVCFAGGSLVGRAPLDGFAAGGQDILEELVDAYLRRLRMLRSADAPSAAAATAASAVAGRQLPGRQAGSRSVASSDSEEEDVDMQEACEVCGRTYPHEHVRAVYRRQDSDDGEEDGGSEERGS